MANTGSQNYSKGKRGFQPSLTESQKAELLRVWIQFDWKSEPARLILKERHGIELAERTLSIYKKDLREMYSGALDDSDSIGDWSDFSALERHGVPQMHLNFLHVMWEAAQVRHILEEDLPLLKPSYRFLRWCAYVLEYFGVFITDSIDIQFVAEQFCNREIMAKYSGYEMSRGDLDSWLIFKPWASEENMMRYLNLVEQEKIPPLDLDLSIWDLGTVRAVPRPEMIERAHNLLNTNLLMNRSPVPYLLPSQVLERYVDRIIKELKEEQAEREDLSGS